MPKLIFKTWNILILHRHRQTTYSKSKTCSGQAKRNGKSERDYSIENFLPTQYIVHTLLSLLHPNRDHIVLLEF